MFKNGKMKILKIISPSEIFAIKTIMIKKLKFLIFSIWEKNAVGEKIIKKPLKKINEINQ